MAGIGAFYELEVCCRGRPDPQTGYLLDISQIDQAVREHAVWIIQRATQRSGASDPGKVLAQILAVVQTALDGKVWSIGWKLSPYYCVEMTAAVPNRVLISQQFEFSASHRLHCEGLTDARNREIFGKCNNPSGHGHNYRLEVAVSVPLPPSSPTDAGEPDGGPSLMLAELERIVHQQVILRFDHKHLNLDTAEFARLNPSVEHIAKVCHDLLAGPIGQAGGDLSHVTVWETEKTSCRYPAID